MTTGKPKKQSDRGQPAGFDRRSGAVSGSGSGAGGNLDSSEDYDSDLHIQASPRAKTGPESR